jgi:hypothetical protein
MDNTSQQQFKEALSQNNQLGIVVGKNPTVDDMAGALALYLSLKAANKQVTIAAVSQPIVELASLVGIDEVKPSLGGASGGDLVVSFPYQEGEIEKVSYTIDNGFLNIVVKAGDNGLTFAESDVRFTRGGGGVPTLLIAVGTAHLTALGELINPEALKDTTIVNIDNKAENQGFGDIVMVAPQYSSVSEQVANIILSNGLPLDVDGAQNLMNGISFATNNFQSPQTSFYAFEIVAELMRRGAVRLPVVPAQTAPIPSYMQPQPQQQAPMQRPQNMPRPQHGQGMPRNQYGQQSRGGQQSQQNQPRMQQRMNQNQNQQPRSQQQQSNRQDEIRRALAEQARAAQQQNPQVNQMNQPNPNMQPMPQPQPMSHPQPQPQSVQQPANPMPQQPQNQPQQDEAPSDWLTPKVYKGSSNLS